jgi:hypothetical protein
MDGYQRQRGRGCRIALLVDLVAQIEVIPV